MKHFWKFWINKTQQEKRYIQACKGFYQQIFVWIPKKNIHSIYIGGSFYKRQLKQNSDIDIHIITNIEKPFYKFDKKILGIRINVKVNSYNQLINKKPNTRQLNTLIRKTETTKIWGEKLPKELIITESKKQVLKRRLAELERITQKQVTNNKEKTKQLKHIAKRTIDFELATKELELTERQEIELDLMTRFAYKIRKKPERFIERHKEIIAKTKRFITLAKREIKY